MIHHPFKSVQTKSHQLNAKTLASVKIEGYIRDLTCELNVQQTFINNFDSNIEAVYTFPLPYGAVLTDLQVKIGDRELKGSVVPKRQAELRYEEAISEGDGAIMLERADNGICTINMGNLLPGERAIVSYQYAYLLSWQKDTVRFMLPTTIAPRYGDPIAGGFQPHQVPVDDVFVEHRFSFKLTVEGLLSNAMFDSPSHRIAVQHKNHKSSLLLNENQAFMDRDFVLNMKSSDSNKSAGQLCKDEIGSSYTALASFSPSILGPDVPSICAKILVDCSGSMAGHSIEQAKAGLHRILDNLRDTDTFNIVCFGNHHQAHFPYCVPATRRHLSYARQVVDAIDANMGGTEMAQALDYTYALKDDGERPASVLLITDGHINEHQQVVARAQQSAQHVYTVGVGSAVSESFLRDLAERTQGFCELVSPNEGMADAIYRQFKRMSQSQIVKVDIEWPSAPLWQYPQAINTVFAGDTVPIFASFKTPAVGEIKLVLHLDNGETLSQSIELAEPAETWPNLPRVAIAQSLEPLALTDKAKAEELAIQYQLLTSYTNFLILDIRETEQKAVDLPNLVQVPQMRAAGIGGTGIINRPQKCVIMPSPFDVRPAFDQSTVCYSLNSNLEELYPKAPFWEKKCSVKSEFTDIFNLIIEAEDNWFTVFNTKLLPEFPNFAAQYYQLIHDNHWSEQQVAMVLICVFCQKLSIDVSVNILFANAISILIESAGLLGNKDFIDLLDKLNSEMEFLSIPNKV